MTGEDLNMRYRIVPEKDDDGKERFILYVEKDGALYRYYYYDPDQY